MSKQKHKQQLKAHIFNTNLRNFVYTFASFLIQFSKCSNYWIAFDSSKTKPKIQTHWDLFSNTKTYFCIEHNVWYSRQIKEERTYTREQQKKKTWKNKEIFHRKQNEKKTSFEKHCTLMQCIQCERSISKYTV